MGLTFLHSSFSSLYYLLILSVYSLAVVLMFPAQVSDFYKRSNVDSPAKAALEDSSHMFDSRGVQLLGQIRHGSCRPRAIMFKVLADTVGLESRLVVVRFIFIIFTESFCVYLIIRDSRKKIVIPRQYCLQ